MGGFGRYFSSNAPVENSLGASNADGGENRSMLSHESWIAVRIVGSNESQVSY